MNELGTSTRVPAFYCSVIWDLPHWIMDYLAGQIYNRIYEYNKEQGKIINSEVLTGPLRFQGFAY